MSIASVAEERRKIIQKKIEEEKERNEIRRKQIARLNAALQAIKEIKEKKYNENQCVVGTGIVLENQRTRYARSIRSFTKKGRTRKIAGITAATSKQVTCFVEEIITTETVTLREDGYSPKEYKKSIITYHI